MPQDPSTDNEPTPRLKEKQLEALQQIAEFDELELRALRELAQDRASQYVNRRSLIKGAGTIAGMGIAGSVGYKEGVQQAKAAPSTSDNDGDIGTPSNRVDVFADGVDAASVHADQVDITERWNFDSGYQLPMEQVTSDSSYNNEPHPIIAPNGDLLLIYRKGSGHATDDAKLVQRRSTDWRTGSPTWGSETTIVDDASYDDRNQEVGVDYDAGRIFIHYFIYNNGSSSDIGQFYVTSTDSGKSWSSRTDISSKVPNARKPFGQPVETSQGWMQLYYDSDYVETVFSTDDGASWSQGSTVIDTTGDSNTTVTEPAPVVIPAADGKQNQVLILGRDNYTKQTYYSKSTDGGQSFGAVSKMELDVGASPIRPLQTSENTVAIAVGSRNNRLMRYYHTSAYWLWHRPEHLASLDYSVLFEDAAVGADMDFGYPGLVKAGPNPQDVIVSWYSQLNATGVDVWICSASAAMGSSPQLRKESLAAGAVQNTSDINMG